VFCSLVNQLWVCSFGELEDINYVLLLDELRSNHLLHFVIGRIGRHWLHLVVWWINRHQLHDLLVGWIGRHWHWEASIQFSCLVNLWSLLTLFLRESTSRVKAHYNEAFWGACDIGLLSKDDPVWVYLTSNFSNIFTNIFAYYVIIY